MENEVQSSVTAAMDTALAQGGMDVVRDMAHFVQSRMICQIMGIPAEDRTLFDEWTAARTNAFFAKFLPPEVQQRTRDAGDYIQIMIEDKGIGISKEARKHIFDKFYRVKNDRTHEIKGSGLGLIVAKQFTELLNGVISINSSEESTIAKLEFPYSQKK
jgi:light-regulated signal transduction histidine kinase (bacteriophytochrome)